MTDAEVAEKVMGWEVVEVADDPGPFWISPDGEKMAVVHPRYLTDPAADYEVLKHVRESWDDFERSERFREILGDIWGGRKAVNYMHGPSLYEPGDYSRAALAVVREDEHRHED